MFRLLLDEHISPAIAEQLRAALPDAEVTSVHSWENGRLLQQSDERILLEARENGWTLLTFDLATIPPLLSEMIEMAEDHAGVIFVSTKSFAQNDYGGLVRSLAAAWSIWQQQEWTNRIEFLQKIEAP